MLQQDNCFQDDCLSIFLKLALWKFHFVLSAISYKFKETDYVTWIHAAVIRAQNFRL